MKTVIEEVSIGGRKERFRKSAPGCNGPESIWFWPMTADYGLYDEALYEGMTTDEARNAHYRRAISEVVPGKVVLDLGTGADAIWAIECAKAGARRVYAIEAGDDAYRSASEKVASFPEIEVFHGFSTAIDLPEKVDVCVSEILGEIGSSEGCIPVLADARERFLRGDGRFIPERCASPIAVIELPAHLAEKPAFDEESIPYVRSALEGAGQWQDLRVNLGFDLSQVHRLSGSDYLEDLDFRSLEFRPNVTSEIAMTVTKEGTMHGFVSWLHLAGLYDDEPLDTLQHETNWYPVFWPVFWPGRSVEVGDRIEATVSITHPEGQWAPEYAIAGALLQSSGRTDFSMRLPRLKGGFREHPFYEALFPDQ